MPPGWQVYPPGWQPEWTAKIHGIENRVKAETVVTGNRITALEARVDRMAGVLRAIVAERDAGTEPTDSENE